MSSYLLLQNQGESGGQEPRFFYHYFNSATHLSQNHSIKYDKATHKLKSVTQNNKSVTQNNKSVTQNNKSVTQIKEYVALLMHFCGTFGAFLWHI